MTADQPEWRRLSTDKGKAIMNVQAGLLQHLRDILHEKGHIEVLAPIIGPVTDPGIRGAKQATIDYYGNRYKLMSSAILYKQLAMNGHDKIYINAPCIRLEPLETAETGRHLTEFFQLDCEINRGTLDDAVALAEDLIRGACTRIWETHRNELTTLKAKEWDMTKHFVRMRHSDAVARLRKEGFEMPDNVEIPWEGEKILSELYDAPFAITHYPRGSRGFYDKLDPSGTGLLLDFDFLYPGGYGEAVSGAERETDLRIVIERMRESGEDIKKYGWYIEMLRDGCPSSAGFGIGIERLTRFVCGLKSVTEARPFPKVAGKVSP